MILIPIVLGTVYTHRNRQYLPQRAHGLPRQRMQGATGTENWRDLLNITQRVSGGARNAPRSPASLFSPLASDWTASDVQDNGYCEITFALFKLVQCKIKPSPLVLQGVFDTGHGERLNTSLRYIIQSL